MTRTTCFILSFFTVCLHTFNFCGEKGTRTHEAFTPACFQDKFLAPAGLSPIYILRTLSGRQSIEAPWFTCHTGVQSRLVPRTDAFQLAEDSGVEPLRLLHRPLLSKQAHYHSVNLPFCGTGSIRTTNADLFRVALYHWSYGTILFLIK